MKGLTVILAVVALSCRSEDALGVSLEDDRWDVNINNVEQGCFSGRDCIPSIDSPNYSAIDATALSFLNDDDLVVGIYDGENYVAYPHPVLNWHEIVNEDGFVISYCPLTGSALHFNSTGEFGVSGLLYNNNLIMYDRDTESYWPQLLLRSASGSQRGEGLQLKTSIETTWGFWKRIFPESKVLNSNTGYSRNYSAYPYGDYKSCNSTDCSDFIYFSLTSFDDRLPAKERVLTIVTETEQMAFPINQFAVPVLLERQIGGSNYRVIISAADNLAMAFVTNLNLTIESWNTQNGDIRLKDTNSSDTWNLLGVNLDGNAPDLIPAPSFISYWFASAAFYPDLIINQ